MTPLLQKKTTLSHGIPPSLLGWQDFWDMTQGVVEAWGKTAFGAAMEPTLKQRKVMSAEDVKADLAEDKVLVTAASAGFSVVAMDTSCAGAYAAKRLNDQPEAIAELSDLLLRLICEEPLGAIKAAVAKAFSDNPEDTGEESPSFGTDFPLAPGGFESDSRYLVIAYVFALEGVEAGIKLVFELGALRKLARDHAKHGHSAGKLNGLRGTDQMRQTVLTSTVNIAAILDRSELSLGACVRMEPGQIIPLPNIEGRRMMMAVETLEGHQDIAPADLGAIKENRALKLTGAVDPSFLRGLVPQQTA
jgi:hypothetical protein